ncbi:hypothetical protein EBBID32_9680 [Sphingobium indicum BiD32]|uniref:Uncharacterized protein n=1 Tax=Sphingobium indicum BiD32 TaxID=1301087 RepID=N1MI70_9SPHN|nr:hypothetical protein EBBID32_9680 [Sphingobium indicum BiD32]
MPPPKLAAHTPGLDILHPVEEGLFPCLGDDFDPPVAHRLHRRDGQLGGIDIPLIGQPGFDHYARTVAERRLDDARLEVGGDLLAFLVLRDVRHEEAQRLHLRDHSLARAVHAVAPEAVHTKIRFRHQTIGRLHDIGIRIEHVEHRARRDPRALADLEIIEIMPRRDLDRAGPQFRVGIIVADDPQPPPGDRLEDLLADHALVARVIGMDRDRHIGQHRFGPCRRDDDMVGPVGQTHAIGQRIFEPPETALRLLRLHLQIGNGGSEMRVPIDQPLVAIEQAALVQFHEHLDHRLAEMRVHGELFAAPVHRTAQPPQLAGDGAAAFLLPLPHFGDKFVARVIGALLALGVHLPLDHHLGRDARMVGADHPQRILSAQPLITDHDVLQRIVERMADMQAAGHIGRRIDDRIGLRVRPFGTEQAVRLPMLVPAGFDIGGVECFGQIGHAPRFNDPRAKIK